VEGERLVPVAPQCHQPGPTRVVGHRRRAAPAVPTALQDAQQLHDGGAGDTEQPDDASAGAVVGREPDPQRDPLDRRGQAPLGALDSFDVLLQVADRAALHVGEDGVVGGVLAQQALEVAV
jgi:hypothetical protein